VETPNIQDSNDNNREKTSNSNNRALLLGEDYEPKSKSGGATEKTSEIKNILEQTKQKLNERGEKLNEMSLKSEEMKNNAMNFHEMAKKLKEKQKNSWF
jgi:hypothetical protein